jgi:hypothetical protein
MDASDELLEEPLFLDGIAIRRWSDVARLPRPVGSDQAPRRELGHHARPGMAPVSLGWRRLRPIRRSPGGDPTLTSAG